MILIENHKDIKIKDIKINARNTSRHGWVTWKLEWYIKVKNVVIQSDVIQSDVFPLTEEIWFVLNPTKRTDDRTKIGERPIISGNIPV